MSNSMHLPFIYNPWVITQSRIKSYLMDLKTNK